MLLFLLWKKNPIFDYNMLLINDSFLAILQKSDIDHCFLQYTIFITSYNTYKNSRKRYYRLFYSFQESVPIQCLNDMIARSEFSRDNTIPCLEGESRNSTPGGLPQNYSNRSCLRSDAISARTIQKTSTLRYPEIEYETRWQTSREFHRQLYGVYKYIVYVPVTRYTPVSVNGTRLR